MNPLYNDWEWIVRPVTCCLINTRFRNLFNLCKFCRQRFDLTILLFGWWKIEVVNLLYEGPRSTWDDVITNADLNLTKSEVVWLISVTYCFFVESKSVFTEINFLRTSPIIIFSLLFFFACSLLVMESWASRFRSKDFKLIISSWSIWFASIALIYCQRRFTRSFPFPAILGRCGLYVSRYRVVWEIHFVLLPAGSLRWRMMIRRLVLMMRV